MWMSDGWGGSMGLQKGGLPQLSRVLANPDVALGSTSHRGRAAEGSAVPSEAYLYEVVFEAFRNDNAFKERWKVVDCARMDPQESVASGCAHIRVVMDLPPSVRLYPTAYIPDFPIIPAEHTEHAGLQARHHSASSDGATRDQELKKLPSGYSVALEVHLLAEARVLLRHQRAFRNGEIEPKHQWLDDIVSAYDGNNGGPPALEPRGKRQARPKATVSRENTEWHQVEDIASPSGQLELQRLRASYARQRLMVDATEPDQDNEAKPRLQDRDLDERNAPVGAWSSKLKAFSDEYGGASATRAGGHCALGKSEVYAENELISVFSTSGPGIKPGSS